MKEIVGRKLGMTRIFSESGEAVPVTVVEAGPCPVVARRAVDKDGYEALQIGFGKVKKVRKRRTRRRGPKVLSHANQAVAGQYARAGVEPREFLREIRFDEGEIDVGSDLTVTLFNEGELVDVIGISRGLGFAGTMKRHGFSGANKTHGQSDRWRAPGSIGQCATPSRVFKGKRMSGRMGHDKVTVLKLRIVKIIEDENLMLIKGAVPGSKGSLVKVRTSNRSRNGLSK
ncbi:MAG: 50S ribosomal protein L3 [Candidatus Zixiibacteriota bacterium]|nr:MAG: 50S ribosomal protein L3 [candidate division Zixibacteria bacterium]